MNTQEKTLREQAREVFENIIAQARGATIKARLQACYDACEDIVNDGGVPHPTNVVGWVATHRSAAKFKAQTIYNSRPVKQPDGTTAQMPSHYSQIIEAWARVSKDRALAKSGGTPSLKPGQYLSAKDLAEIPDDMVRHKVAFMLGRFQQLTTQAEMRAAIRDNPPVPGIAAPSDQHDAIEYNLALDDDELEALKDFLNEKVADRRGLEFNGVGSVIAMRVNNGKAISRPAFVDAIEKIIKSYAHPTYHKI